MPLTIRRTLTCLTISCGVRRSSSAMGWDTVSSATFQLCYLCLSDLLYVCMYVRMIGWIDSLRALAASHVSDAMFQNASNRFPENTPVTKEVHTYIIYIQDYYTYLKRNTYIQIYLLCIMYSTYAYTVYIHTYIHTAYIYLFVTGVFLPLHLRGPLPAECRRQDCTRGSFDRLLHCEVHTECM